MKKSIGPVLAVLTALFLFYGCGGKEAKITPIQEVKAPEWVIKGNGAFSRGDNQVFHGIGSAFGINNPALLRTTADNRAREEIAKTFQFYISSLMKDYMASTMAGDPNISLEEQHVEQGMKTVTSMTLSGVLIVDHWQNPQTGEFFSLAELDLKAFTDSLKKVKELDAQAREYIKKHAERLHEELEKEVEKLRER